MTNRQWLLEQMQNMSDEELGREIACKFDICQKQLDGGGCYKYEECEYCYFMWLKSEHKEQIKLSDAERVILENIDKKYKWLVRERCGALFIQTDMEKPYKDDEGWHGYGVELDFFNHLFQFIKWEDENPYSIEELLKQK